MIEVDHIGKSFGSVEVLKDISATFADGEVVAIIGPSGGGKSTLIRCINGLERLDRGDIRVDGKSVKNHAALKAIRSACAMVFQQFNLYPHMTVLANITLAPVVVLKKPRAAAEAKARELLAMVGLGDRAGAYPSELSGGQQQRIGICRALAMEPRHLLLDEVTSALDPEMTAEVLTVIERLAKAGTTMILVTHEMEFARRVADRAVFMEAGRLVADQPIGKFFGNAQDPRIQRFLTKMTHQRNEADRP
jgi:ABC-type polar amino acid transport system ATPase subunit